MSTVLEKKPRTKSGGGGTALSGTLPQVNLLPPEVRAARGLRATKRWLLISLIVTFALCAGGFGLALISGASAATELAEAQTETERLQLEQQKYAEVPQVLGALDQATTARSVGMSTEVEWKQYVDAITAVLPAGVYLDTFTVTGATPTVPAAAPTDPLQGPSVGQIQFTAYSRTVPDVAALIDSLASVPGFTDPWATSAELTEEDGVFYNVIATVQFTDTAYAHRFDAVQEGS
ncbi:fimbrial assembly protein [Cellulomonas sp. H30R-01]|uniref:PilN domain-containing protein n=1 Tax=Cellulomonas sp. H30R-01 TaxID=2704467 RepID=UPI00138CD6E8|nr:PilN domain-containing protein [Cellulomonas sp. H30R-01]QHT55833.1 fimbrial assembly protein [Cellulomonas sp. H30R-01]